MTGRQRAGLFCVVLALGLLGGSALPRNGDAALYGWLVEQGAVTGRWVHAGYLVQGWLLMGRLGLLSALAAAACVTLSARSCWAAPLVGLALITEARFAEVDVVWLAWLWAATQARGWMAGALAGVALSVSPSVLLALPVAAGCARAPRWLVGGAVLGLLVLSLASGGVYWTGPRGLWAAQSLMPGRTLAAALLGLPWLGAYLLWRDWPGGRRAAGWALAAAPLLLAPPDVPAYLVLLVPLAVALARGPAVRRELLAAALGCQLVLSGVMGWRVEQRVRAESALVAGLGQPAGVLVLPWSLGVRWSIVQAGAPYAGAWLTPGGSVNAAQDWVCARPGPWRDAQLRALPAPACADRRTESRPR